MKKSLPLLICLQILCTICNGQIQKLKYKERHLKRFTAEAKTDMLTVVIENEKNPEDAALVNAVKKYWKQGKYQFISQLEFTNRLRDKLIKKEDLYLYTLRGQYKNKSYRMSPYMLVNNAGKRKKEFGFSFAIANGGYDLKGRVLDGYYDLMVKYFDHEIALTKDPESRKNLKKKKDKGITFFTDDPEKLKEKNILFVKEVINTGKTNSVKEKTENYQKKEEEIIKRYHLDPKKVYTVFPEDINMSVAKMDQNVLVFDGSDLINPADGSIVATSYRPPRKGLLIAYYIANAVIVGGLFTAGILLDF
ncbi:MAG: hypothetical protein K0S32_2472 [Bacteroidetes bacterium]|jgi:hypothetical protein|nr:hypothetical protein [Bacteroidota bacterium]